MKTTIITEFVKIEALQTTTDEQVITKANLVNDFLRNQDGFIDSELVKALEGNTWYLIYHIENLEKLREVGAKLRSNKLFDELIPLTIEGSMSFSFFNQVRKW
jgi:hypothetical protein